MSEETPKYIRMLEEDIETLRRETNAKIEGLGKDVESTLMLYYKIFSAMIHFMSSSIPRTKKTVIAEYRFVREFYQGLIEWSPPRAHELDTLFKDLLIDVLRGASVIPFDEMIDVLLRGLGIDLTRKFVSPDIIAEVWGAKALEKFQELLSE